MSSRRTRLSPAVRCRTAGLISKRMTRGLHTTVWRTATYVGIHVSGSDPTASASEQVRVRFRVRFRVRVGARG